MKMKRTQMLLSALLATTALTVGAAASSQTMGPVWDSSQLPESRGTVRQYTLTPRGDADGLILNDGTEVKLPPHLTGQIIFAVQPALSAPALSRLAVTPLTPSSPPAGASGTAARRMDRIAAAMRKPIAAG